MTQNDSIITSINVPVGPATNKRPPYLVVFEDEYEEVCRIVTTDRPDILNGFILVKGIHVDPDHSLEELQTGYSELLSNNKENIVEKWIPTLKIFWVQNLVFKTKS